MVYYCDNETVDRVEMPTFPKILAPNEDGMGPIVVADMSSDILSRRILVKNVFLFFFDAQKSLGSTGVTVAGVLVSCDSSALAGSSAKARFSDRPIVLSYEIIAKNNSLYNTLSIFE